MFQGIDQSIAQYGTIRHAPFRAVEPFGAIIERGWKINSRNDKSREMLRCSKMTKMDTIMGTRFAFEKMQVDPARLYERGGYERFVTLLKKVLMDRDYDK